MSYWAAGVVAKSMKVRIMQLALLSGVRQFRDKTVLRFSNGTIAKLGAATFVLCISSTASAASLLDYVGQCVPFAREASGIEIYGDAWTWWDKAVGHYPRGHEPRQGSVIVFSKTTRLPLGHVAVVSRIVDKRVLMLTHANWSRQEGMRGHTEQDVTLFDISDRNDWSKVKVWYRDADGLGGGIYPVKGFVYGGQLASGVTGRQPDYVAALIDAYVPKVH